MYDEHMTRIKFKDVTVFSRHLATMQAAGLPLVQALSIITEQTENRVFKSLLSGITEDVKDGAKFHEAIEKHPSVFPKIYVNMAKAGGMGGNLDIMLDRLSTYMEKEVIFKKRIRHEVINPIILAVVSGVAGLGLLLATIRAHLVLLSASGRELPWMAGVLLSAYNAAHQLANAAVIVGLIVAFIVFLAALVPPIARVIYEGMVFLPFIGHVLKKTFIARFARILATLQRSGVPILEGMDITAQTVGHRSFEAAILKARAGIKEGEGIAAPLKKSGMFPRMVIQMVSAGEETGKLDEMLLRIADYYDAEVEAALLPARIPGIMVVVGLSLLVNGLVLFFIVSPILSAIYIK